MLRHYAFTMLNAGLRRERVVSDCEPLTVRQPVWSISVPLRVHVHAWLQFPYNQLLPIRRTLQALHSHRIAHGNQHTEGSQLRSVLRIKWEGSPMIVGVHRTTFVQHNAER